MFLGVYARGKLADRFPRVRGDVPRNEKLLKHQSAFSPRARGCSALVEALNVLAPVFPACAGMFPRSGSVSNPAGPFSPRARGCSALWNVLESLGGVFPACAGMFLLLICEESCTQRFPRVRGDVPIPGESNGHLIRFSPRARGCSERTALRQFLCRVFPACAGMFRVPTRF